MSQQYSNPKRASDPYSLPDIETFKVTGNRTTSDQPHDQLEAGWYYWSCFPGCLPDGDPIGPFATEEEALEDAREYASDDEDEDGAMCPECERSYGPHYRGRCSH